jgi:hypothetical protein
MRARSQCRYRRVRQSVPQCSYIPLPVRRFHRKAESDFGAAVSYREEESASVQVEPEPMVADEVKEWEQE